ncbi:uncharacterized protein LOC116160355 isoform X2 [Photinus pyralis]|uniref:uncharacterized protein LOC116160355 isoform X2 n=1 Tax=Photinus pyralis TaxID=7054 RepID=UPI0012673407|nr:uncharacterized protein LOC116160355 isoform X2 [Photinus pyralis]
METKCHGRRGLVFWIYEGERITFNRCAQATSLSRATVELTFIDPETSKINSISNNDLTSLAFESINIGDDTINVDNNNIQENIIRNPQQLNDKPAQEPELQHDQAVESLVLKVAKDTQRKVKKGNGERLKIVW